MRLSDDIYRRYCEVPTRKMRALVRPESTAAPPRERRVRTTRMKMQALPRDLLDPTHE